MRRAALVVAALLVTGVTPLVGGTAAAAGSGGVSVVSAPKDVDEGSRIAITAKVASPATAKTVWLQEWQTDIFGYDSWVVVAKQAVRGTAKHTFRVAADGINSERYRVTASYRSGSTVASKAVTVRVWRWMPISAYRSYYETNGVSDSYSSQFGMNGTQYVGWYSYGSYGYWEARYTPGRNCKAFRADLGVTDTSSDGSSATIAFLTDDGTPVYQSPPLTPGMVESVTLPLDLPYRFWVQATDTSPEGPRANPAMGAPAFLCTGV